MSFPPCPKEIKPVAHLLKVAEDHEARNIVVAYWARMAAVHLALKLVPGKKPPEVSLLLTSLLDWLEKTKTENPDNDGITSETTAQALLEEYALGLFHRGDQQDRAGVYNKNTVKTFYTAGILMDILEQFELSEDLYAKRKYAKWKTAYIHNCLKTGETPIPGSQNDDITNLPSDQVSEENRILFEQENRKMQEQEKRSREARRIYEEGEENIFQLPGAKPEDNIFAPAPASSPVTPGVPPKQVPFTPQPMPAAPIVTVPTTPATTNLLPADSGSMALTPDQIQKAQKFCKYATSALNYDDIKTAVDNLTKALNLLQTGREE